jgi:hypothetical protein
MHAVCRGRPTAAVSLQAGCLPCRRAQAGRRNALPRQATFTVTLPDARAGEVLGCTAPLVAAGTDALLFVADGRFHLEAIMIANPGIPAYRRVAHRACPQCSFLRPMLARSFLPAARHTTSSQAHVRQGLPESRGSLKQQL